MSKRLASEVEQDGLATTAQAVWTLITGQRNQIEGLEAATSGSVADQSDFFKTARLVSKASRLAIDSQTVRIPIAFYPRPGTKKNLVARVSRTLADQLDEAARLPDDTDVEGPVARFVASYGSGYVWVMSRRATTYYVFDDRVLRVCGHTRKYLGRN
jgi:hypothetical protein